MKIRGIFAVVLLLAAMPFSFAHLEGGIDLEKDGIIIDIGYDIEHLIAGRPTTFLISLHDANETEIKSTSAWVRIKDADTIVFTAKIIPEPTGAYSFMAAIPQQGMHDITVRFETDQGQIENTGKIQVNESLDKKRIIVLVSTSIFWIVAFTIFINFRKFKKTN